MIGEVLAMRYDDDQDRRADAQNEEVDEEVKAHQELILQETILVIL